MRKLRQLRQETIELRQMFLEISTDRPYIFILFSGTTFDSGLHLEWSPDDVIDVRVGAVYSNGNATHMKLSSQLLTPFAGWRRTSLSGG